MAPLFTIRNVTSASLVLRQIEWYEGPYVDGHQRSGIGNFSLIHVLMSLLTSVYRGDQAFGSQLPVDNSIRMNVRIEPFEVYATDMKSWKGGLNEIMRFTFVSNAQSYTFQTSRSKPGLQAVTMLVPDPSYQYTGFFHANCSLLSLFTSPKLESWMKSIHDSIPISALSIPGTHNSPTCFRALPSIRCQAVSPREQLENGVRFLDIRVQIGQPVGDLILVHDAFGISLTGNKYLRDLIEDTQKFLDRNPSETVIMSLKREGSSNQTDQQLSCVLHDHYAGDSNQWYTEPRLPALGECRGKIVLIRRFKLDERLNDEWGGRGWCIHADWEYNTPYEHRGDVCVQDFCEVLHPDGIDEKIRYVQKQIQRAGARVCTLPGLSRDYHRPVHDETLYMNFLTASNFWNVGCWPEKIAGKVNPAVIEYLCAKHLDGHQGDGSTGILICDWVGLDGDWDLVRCIIGMNSLLQKRGDGISRAR